MALPVGPRTGFDHLGTTADEHACFLRILELVHGQTNIDFSGYRQPTLLRRVRNRMISINIRSFAEYLAFLQTRPSEPVALVERLTIKVSRFFRDPLAFAALAEALTARRSANGHGPCHVWSAGCGRGEEPYSAAMLLTDLGIPVHIAATDVDPTALKAAAAGQFAWSALQTLSPSHRERFFEGQSGGKQPVLRVKPQVRALVEFSWHDLTAPGHGPAYALYDVICCRNVLIYFSPAVQEHVFALLTQSLKPGGILFLGEAEWLLPAYAGHFETVDRKYRLFQRKSPYAPA